MKEAIAVIGRACHLPGVDSPEELWQAVCQQRDLTRSCPDDRWRLRMETVLNAEGGLDRTVTNRGGYLAHPKPDLSRAPLPSSELESLDPLFQWTVCCAAEALMDAQQSPIASPRTGAIFGNLSYPCCEMSRYAEGIWKEKPEGDARNIEMSSGPALLLKRACHLTGPCFALDAACASALYAIRYACDALNDGRADMMLAGAVNQADDLFIHMGFTALKALSPTGQSRPFEQEADGLLPAEGVAFVVLERLSDARAHHHKILGVIRSVGLSNDGRQGGILAPSVEGQIRALKSAYLDANLQPSDVSLLECHATGTPVGDKVEIESARAIFGSRDDLYLGSLKGNMGHLITAAGVAALLKVLEGFSHNERPLTRKINTPIASPYPFATQRAPWFKTKNHPRIAAISAFGFGGNNAHLIVSDDDPSIPCSVAYQSQDSDSEANPRLNEDWLSQTSEYSSFTGNKDWKNATLDFASEPPSPISENDDFQLGTTNSFFGSSEFPRVAAKNSNLNSTTPEVDSKEIFTTLSFSQEPARIQPENSSSPSENTDSSLDGSHFQSETTSSYIFDSQFSRRIFGSSDQELSSSTQEYSTSGLKSIHSDLLPAVDQSATESSDRLRKVLLREDDNAQHSEQDLKLGALFDEPEDEAELSLSEDSSLEAVNQAIEEAADALREASDVLQSQTAGLRTMTNALEQAKRAVEIANQQVKKSNSDASNAASLSETVSSATENGVLQTQDNTSVSDSSDPHHIFDDLNADELSPEAYKQAFLDAAMTITKKIAVLTHEKKESENQESVCVTTTAEYAKEKNDFETDPYFSKLSQTAILTATAQALQELAFDRPELTDSKLKAVVLETNDQVSGEKIPKSHTDPYISKTLQSLILSAASSVLKEIAVRARANDNSDAVPDSTDDESACSEQTKEAIRLAILHQLEKHESIVPANAASENALDNCAQENESLTGRTPKIPGPAHITQEITHALRTIARNHKQKRRRSPTAPFSASLPVNDAQPAKLDSKKTSIRSKAEQQEAGYQSGDDLLRMDLTQEAKAAVLAAEEIERKQNSGFGLIKRALFGGRNTSAPKPKLKKEEPASTHVAPKAISDADATSHAATSSSKSESSRAPSETSSSKSESSCTASATPSPTTANTSFPSGNINSSSENSPSPDGNAEFSFGNSSFPSGQSDSSKNLLPGEPTVPQVKTVLPDIVITGIGVVAGGASNLQAFKTALETRKPLGAIRNIEIPKSKLRFPPNDLDATLPQQLALIQAALEAVPEAHKNTRAAVFAGMSTDPNVCRYGLRWRESSSRNDLEASDRDQIIPALRSAGVVGCMPNIVANRINAWFDWGGPSTTVSADALSGTTALQLAIRALQTGEIDEALVCAVDLRCDPVHQAAAADIAQTKANAEAAHTRVPDSQPAPINAASQSDSASSDALTFVRTGEFSRTHDYATPIAKSDELENISKMPRTAEFLRSEINDSAKREAAQFSSPSELADSVLHKESAISHVETDAFDDRSDVSSIGRTGEFLRTAPRSVSIDKPHVSTNAFCDAAIAFHLMRASDANDLAIARIENSTNFPRMTLPLPDAGAASDLLQLAAALCLTPPGERMQLNLQDHQQGVQPVAFTVLRAPTARPQPQDTLCWSAHKPPIHLKSHSETVQKLPQAPALPPVSFWSTDYSKHPICEDSIAPLSAAEFSTSIQSPASKEEVFHTAPLYTLTESSAVQAVEPTSAAKNDALQKHDHVTTSGITESSFRNSSATTGSTDSQTKNPITTTGNTDSQIKTSVTTHGNIEFESENQATTIGNPEFININSSIPKYASNFTAAQSSFSYLNSLHQTYMNAQAEAHRAFLQFEQRAQSLLLQSFSGYPAVSHPAFSVSTHPTHEVPQPPHLDTSTLSATAQKPQLSSSESCNALPQHTFSSQTSSSTAQKPQSSLQSTRPAPSSNVAPQASTLPILKGTPLWDRAQLEIHAAGKLSDLFGPDFAPLDAYPIRVRMPRPPLLLADRVMEIEGRPGKMGKGRIVTETDVRRDAWYASDGVMPAGVMIESGQADLLLISYLGVDFLNQGERAYRLLACDLTYHDGLPKAGDTLRYQISIDGHANHGDVRLFFFHYDCRVKGSLRLEVRGGQAGFFTTKELADSKGVLWDPPAAPDLSTACKLGSQEIELLCQGRVADVFGPNFNHAKTHTRSPHLAAKTALFHRAWISDRYLRAEWDFCPNDWFFDGHFHCDPCMPGTLMFEGCLQAMAVYMMKQGFTLYRDGWRFEPVPDHSYHLVCRGQATPASHLLRYELFVRDVIEGDDPTIFADLLVTIDGLKAFHAAGMGLHMVPDWPLEEKIEGYKLDPRGAIAQDHRYNYRSLLATAWGKPSEAFGAMYRRFDSAMRVARLPGPPYHFLSRVEKIEGTPAEMKIGTRTVIAYDVPPDAWYFKENSSPVMPFCVFLEAALQPCGWLASFVGSALTSEKPLSFRNLDGRGAVLAEIHPDGGCLRTDVTITKIAQSGDMIIEGFKLSVFQEARAIYSLDTVFGFFPEEALKNQVGLPENPAATALYKNSSAFSVDLRQRPSRYFANTARLARPMLCMLDRVTGFWANGGKQGLGAARGEKDVNPDEWFFKAHFFQDPVQPGSLGLEAMLQLLQFCMLELQLDETLHAPRFEPCALGETLIWKYRGQVIPENRCITTTVELTAIDREPGRITAHAEASLFVDGKRIYEAQNLAMRLVEQP